MWTDNKGRTRTDQADLEDTRARLANLHGCENVVIPAVRMYAMLNDGIADEEMAAERDALKAEVERLTKIMADDAARCGAEREAIKMECFVRGRKAANARIAALEEAAKMALERIGGDARDGNLGWHKDHPVVDALRKALEEKA